MRRRLRRIGRSLTVATLLTICCSPPAHAQSANPFGVQDRADAAQRAIVLAVQQGISSLPPTSGQSFVYDLDPELGTFLPSPQLGPTSFRSPQLVGKNRLSVRVATSLFEVDETFGPAAYKVTGPSFQDPPGFCTQFGTSASAQVSLVNIGANFGVLDRLETMVNFPVVFTDTDASELFLGAGFGDGSGDVVIAPECAVLQGQSAGAIVERDFDDVATRDGSSVSFNSGSHVGLGRVSLGAKVRLFANEQVQLVFMPEIFLPSPNEDEFAGSESVAILPRLVFQARPIERLRLHLDIGYDYDFDYAALRRLTTNPGLSVPPAALSRRLTPAAGVGGSEFEEGIRWSPTRALAENNAGGVIRLRSLGDTELDTSYVDFLGGAKLQLNDRLVLSAAVNVPLNDAGFRADVVGTFALEFYFEPLAQADEAGEE